MRIDIEHPNGTAPLDVAVYESQNPLTPGERFLGRVRFAGTGDRSGILHTAATAAALRIGIEEFYSAQFAEAAKKGLVKRGRPPKKKADEAPPAGDDIEETI